MAENRRLERNFLWGLAAAFGFIALFFWANYFIGQATWHSSWGAWPFTVAAIAAALGAYFVGRRTEKVRLRR